MELIITDSGLGGLSICAGIEQALRGQPEVRLVYVNAWPEEGRGYNDLPDMPARARVFERVLRRIEAMQPDALLVACNTLSIVYEATGFSRAPAFPVRGIVNAGVDLFRETLAARPSAALVLLGTRTTIESGVHRARLLEAGVAPDRVGAASCHGLAAAIERGPESPATSASIGECAERASGGAPAGEPLYAGLCCTHYAMASDRICEALARRARRTVLPLDPNLRMVREAAAEFGGAPEGNHHGSAVPVDVVSKVALDDRSRAAVAALLEPVSAATADALRAYRHVRDLFSFLLFLVSSLSFSRCL